VYIFGKKCIEMGVREAALVAVASDQCELPDDSLNAWAQQFGISITIFYDWYAFVDQVLYWSAAPKIDAASNAVEFIRSRLVEVEVAEESVELWTKMIEERSG
jgi:hypothetical protein